MDELYTAESTDDIFASVSAEDIEYIEPNYIVELFDTEMFSATEPNDQYYRNGSQWNLDTLNVPAAWEYGLEGQSISDDKSVVVAVIDSGINRSHQDLDESHILEGYSYVTTNTANTDDTMGHGTFCVGQIFATRDNEVGIAGIVPEVYIMPLRVFGSSNQAYTSDIVSAINYATGTGEVDVISMSLGGEGSSSSMKAACEAATENGILVIAAAGNDGDFTINYPAAYGCVIGVGSVGSDNSPTERSYFSQKGIQNVFCVTPGFKIVSTYYDSTTSYYRGNGTSFACPEVAALAAIAKSIDRSITQDEFMQVIIDTSTDLGDAGRDALYGYGLVNFQTAIEALIGGGSGDAGVTVIIENENGEAVENAEIKITRYGETEELLPGEDGTYTLEKGKYSYTVTTDRYQTATGVFSVITGSRILRIVLEGEAYPVSITPVNTRGETLEKAVISIKNAKGAEMTKLEQGVYEFRLKNGSYIYSVSATSYYTQTGTFTIKDGGDDLTVGLYGDIDVASAKLRIVNADGEPVTGVTVTLFNAEGGEVVPYTDGYGGNQYDDLTMEDRLESDTSTSTANTTNRGSIADVMDIMNSKNYAE